MKIRGSKKKLSGKPFLESAINFLAIIGFCICVSALIFFAICIILIYSCFFIIAKFILNILPEYNLWRDVIIGSEIVYFNLSLFEILSIFIYCPLALYGIYMIVDSLPDPKKKDCESRDVIKFEKNGLYSKVRHPIYAGFIIFQTGLWLSLCSLYSVFIVILFDSILIFNTYRKENNELIPKFGKEYKEYMNEVKPRLFKKGFLIYFILTIIFSVVGIWKL
ncbi:MAG: hypothetical protein ABF289_19025 [Clostridiales bacterium]